MNVKRHAIVETYFHYSCIVYHNDIADPILAATIQITTVGYHTIGQSRSQPAKFGMRVSCIRWVARALARPTDRTLIPDLFL